MGKWNLPPRGEMDRASGIYYQTMTQKEIHERRKKNDVIIIPIGSTETHGPGQPLGEDTYLCTRMAEEVARVTGCTVALPISYGAHPYHHVGMPGTVIIPDRVLIDYIMSVMAGFWNAGFRKMILLNGHGQEWIIPCAIHDFAKKYQVPGIYMMLHWWYAAGKKAMDKEHGGPFDFPLVHACEVECSFTQAIAPEMVKTEDLVDVEVRSKYVGGKHHFNDPCEMTANPVRWWHHAGCLGSEFAWYPEGNLGPSTQADAKKAIEGVEAVLDYMESLVNDIIESVPPGTVPPYQEFTHRDNADYQAVLKNPEEPGWKNLYTLGFPTL